MGCWIEIERPIECLLGILELGGLWEAMSPAAHQVCPEILYIFWKFFLPHLRVFEIHASNYSC